MREIEFWFDFSSPYGYFASLQIDAVAEKFDYKVAWLPFLLGAVFKITGMQSLLSTPLRGDYARRDWLRLARQRGIAFAMPGIEPKSSLTAVRAYYAVAQQDAAAAVVFAKAVFRAQFAQGLDISDEHVISAVASEAGCDGADTGRRIVEPEIKARAKAITDVAISKGVFGSPFFFVGDEPFWGSDRMPQLEEWLRRGGW